jgi:hypothetical protein
MEEDMKNLQGLSAILCLPCSYVLLDLVKIVPCREPDHHLESPIMPTSK